MVVHLVVNVWPHSPLSSQGQTLKQESGLSWVFSDDADTFFDLLYKFNSALIPWNSCLNGYEKENVCAFQGPYIMYASLHMSGTVTSQANGSHLAHGIRVAPSGRLPLCTSATKSLTAGIRARFTALQIMSFILLMSLWTFADVSVHFFGMLDHVGHEHQQFFHTYLCVAHMLCIPVFEWLTLWWPRPTSPIEQISGASSQSPECDADAARSFALSTFDDALEKTLVTKLLTIRPFLTVWMCCHWATSFGTSDSDNLIFCDGFVFQLSDVWKYGFLELKSRCNGCLNGGLCSGF